MTLLVSTHRIAPARARSLRAELDRLFDDAWCQLGVATPPQAARGVRLDVGETEDAFVVRAELPGLDAKDIDVSLLDDMLSIEGERSAGEGGRVHRAERFQGRFHRTLRLPFGVDEGAISARYRDGILTVTLPKARPEAREIPIAAD